MPLHSFVSWVREELQGYHKLILFVLNGLDLNDFDMEMHINPK